MDKKEIAEFVQGVVEEIAKTSGLKENVARAFVGTALMQNREAFIACVVIPKLVIATETKAA